MGLAVAVGFAGACGAWARYRVGRALADRAGPLPWATWLVNISGCLLLGALEAARPGGWAARTVLGTGFVGAYTTFSTFCVEVLLLWQARPRRAVAYAAASVVAGFLAVAAGTWVGSRL
jgi:CrcB protein